MAIEKAPIDVLHQMSDKVGSLNAYEVAHLDAEGKPVLPPDQISSKNPFNWRLIYGCVVIACSTLSFGYDNLLISPVAALPAFVRPANNCVPCSSTCLLTLVQGPTVSRPQSDHT